MLKIVKSIPGMERKKRYSIQEEVLSFWANENAKYAEVDTTGYKNIDSAGATYRDAINSLFLRIRTVTRHGKLYLVKGKDSDEQK